MIHREHGWPATIVGEQPVTTSTGHSIYVQIHDGAFEGREPVPGAPNRNSNMPLEVWSIDTLDFVTRGGERARAGGGETPADAAFIKRCTRCNRVVWTREEGKSRTTPPRKCCTERPNLEYKRGRSSGAEGPAAMMRDEHNDTAPDNKFGE